MENMKQIISKQNKILTENDQLIKYKNNKRKTNQMQLPSKRNVPTGRTVSQFVHNILGNNDKTRQQKRKKTT